MLQLDREALVICSQYAHNMFMILYVNDINDSLRTLISQAETFKTQAPQHEIGGVAGHQRSHRPKALFSLDLKLKKNQRLGRSFGLIIKKP
jgi:hypothetical protein